MKYIKSLKKKEELISKFKKDDNITYEVAYYNGHYQKNSSGIYEITYYPIPVITVTNFCDIKVGIDQITISTKLRKNEALKFDYQKLNKLKYEVYGVNDYTADYYEDDNLDNLLKNISLSNEEEIGYSFIFDYSLKSSPLYQFVLFLKENKFYY